MSDDGTPDLGASLFLISFVVRTSSRLPPRPPKNPLSVRAPLKLFPTFSLFAHPPALLEAS